MDAAREDPLGAGLLEGGDGVDEGPGRVDDVVDDQDVPALHVADDVHDLDLVLPLPPLVDDGEGDPEPLAEGARPLHAAGVRRDDRERVELGVADRVEEDGRGEEVVDRDVEVALDLRGVEVDGEDPVGAGGRRGGRRRAWR